MATADCIGAPARVELWRPIPGWPGYRVSDSGGLQSKRHRNGLPSPHWRNVTPVPDGHGYPCVRLYRADGKPHWFGVHQLVMLAFVGPPPAGQVVRHVLTNDPADCRLVNLGYGTQAANCADKHAHGTAQTSERRRDYMTPDERSEVMRLHLAGCPARSLARPGRTANAIRLALRKLRARYAAGNGPDGSALTVFAPDGTPWRWQGMAGKVRERLAGTAAPA